MLVFHMYKWIGFFKTPPSVILTHMVSCCPLVLEYLMVVGSTILADFLFRGLYRTIGSTDSVEIAVKNRRNEEDGPHCETELLLTRKGLSEYFV